MLAYYLLIFTPFLFSFYQKKKGVFRNKKLVIIVFFIIFFLLLAFRSIQCGTDLINYYDMFNYYHNAYKNFNVWSLFNFSLTEPGYRLFEKLVWDVSNGSFQFLLISCALISIIPLFCLYYKESEHSLLTLALFIGIAPFSLYFSGIRQCIAMGVGILCFWATKNKKMLFFFLFVFLAFLFHQSALVLLFMYPLYWLKIKSKHLIFYLPVLLICFILKRQIFTYGLSFLGRFGSAYSATQATGAYGFFILLLIITVFSFVIPNEKKMNSKAYGLRNMLLLMLLIQCFAPISTIAMRMNYYYLIYIPILIPSIIDYTSIKMKSIARISEYIMVFFFIIYFFYGAYFGADILEIFPYIPYWKTN